MVSFHLLWNITHIQAINQGPYWSRPAETAPEMPPKAPERTRPPAPHFSLIFGAKRSEPNQRRKSVTFRRRPGDFPAPSWRLSGTVRPGDFLAPETTCFCGLIIFRRRPGDFPAPETTCIDRFSGAVLGNFRRRGLPVCAD